GNFTVFGWPRKPGAGWAFCSGRSSVAGHQPRLRFGCAWRRDRGPVHCTRWGGGCGWSCGIATVGGPGRASMWNCAMRRIMCVCFPNWPIQRRCHGHSTPEQQPLILFAPGGRRGPRVMALSSGARRCGVTPGMLLAEAQCLCHTALVEAHEPRTDRDALRWLAGWCGRFSPRVAIDAEEPPDCLLLDVTGCGYDFGGEPGLAAAVIDQLQQCG